jgi:hypothetical protein
MISDILEPNIEPSPEQVQIAVLGQIKYVIENELAELEHAMKERPVNAVAWVGRNLLELWVWTVYCTRSPENARRFFDDAARDALGALNLPDGMFTNDPNFSFKTARTEILAEAKQKGVEGLDSSYQRVSDAARDIGKEEYYLAANKLYSKFAHPTALWVMTEQSVLAGFRKKLYDGGVIFGQSSRRYIDAFQNRSE